MDDLSARLDDDDDDDDDDDVSEKCVGSIFSKPTRAYLFAHC